MESDGKTGTTFRVLLNLAGPNEAPSAPAPPRAPASPRRTVLVVDDEELVGNAVKRVLMRQHEVAVVRSVDAALKLIAGGAEFDVILSDLMMPEKTGIELFHDLAKLRPGQEERIIFVTGGAFTAESRAFLESVKNARIDKPFLPDRLLEAVNAAR